MDSKNQLIKRSQAQSNDYQINKTQSGSLTQYQGARLQNIVNNNQELIQLAAPVINMLFKSIAKEKFAVILTNEEGVITQISGTENFIAQINKTGINKGSSMLIKDFGTNAIGLAIETDEAIQLTGSANFVQNLQKWTCSAAPIHDDNNNLNGSVNVIGESSQEHPHTLAMTIAAAHAIEIKLNNQSIQKQLFDEQQYAFAMMNNLSNGVFAIDLNEDIHWVNDTACRTLNKKRTLLINRSITDIVPAWRTIRDHILNNQPYLDEEGHFNIPDLKESFLFNAFPITNKEQEILGYLLTFREYSRMINLVNRYTGMHARFTFDDICGESEITQYTVEYARKVAKSSSTILITGESGTGKEVYAQSIHNASERKDAAFIAINCGAISSSLIESELFGYTEGAFTGARKGGNPGKFELANKGTLFLDEIGEMPLDMQVKLLRAIQEGSITRVGGQKEIPVDVRIIAATNKDLEKEVTESRFRLDLYYRLNVIQIRIPSLQERKDDIVPLARFFMKHKATKQNKPVPHLNHDVVRTMINYNWPGNIRELENFIEKFVILDGIFEPGMLKLKKHKETMAITEPPKTPEKIIEQPIMSITEMEQKMIIRTLEHTSNNMSKTARILGISRNTLYLKLKKHQITPQ